MPPEQELNNRMFPAEDVIRDHYSRHHTTNESASDPDEQPIESFDSGFGSLDSMDVEEILSQVEDVNTLSQQSNPNLDNTDLDPYNNPLHATCLNMSIALHRNLTYPYDWNDIASKSDLANSGFFLIESKNAVQCQFCKIKMPLHKIVSNVDAVHIQLSPDCPLMTNASESEDVPVADTSSYRYEAKRLFTFSSTNWRASVNPCDLARSGFYWTGESDNCRCAFCRLEVRGWESNDTADGEHRRWNRNCHFLNERNVGNVKIGQELNPETFVSDTAGSQNNYIVINPFSHSENSRTYKNLIKTDGRKVSMEMLGVTPINPPRHPEYATPSKRLDSFKLWPLCMPQRPEQLTDAGFYYTGAGDRVICFQCGGGLKDWAEHDTPWDEHARWFPKCPYVLLRKGSGYYTNTTLDKFQQMSIHSAIEAAQESKREAKEYSTSKYQPKGPENVMEIDNTPVPPGSLICRICKKKDINTVYLPCGHMLSCTDCAKTEEICRTCSKQRIAYIHAFLQ